MNEETEMAEEQSQVDEPSNTQETGSEETTEQVTDVNVDDTFSEIDSLEDYEEQAEALLEDIPDEETGGESPDDSEEIDEVESELEEEETTSTDQEEIEEEEELEEEEPEDKPEEVETVANRYRVKAFNDIDAQALALKKRNPDLTLEECLDRVRPDEDSEATEEDETEKALTSADIEERIKALQKAELQHAEEMEFVKSAEARQEIDKLNREYQELKLREQESDSAELQRAQQEFEQANLDSQEKAVQFYPDTSKPDSALTKRMIEIDETLNELGDPLFNDPDKPLKLAQMAAKELGIAPNSKRPQRKTVKKSTARTSPLPAGGNQSTQKGSSANRIGKALENIDNLDEFEDLVEAMDL